MIDILRIERLIWKNHNFENEGQFQRKMTSRYLFMSSLGGVIGTALFLSSGYTIAQAGPLGAVLSYLVWSSCRLSGHVILGGTSYCYASHWFISYLCDKIYQSRNRFYSSLALLDLLDGGSWNGILRISNAYGTLVPRCSDLAFCDVFLLQSFSLSMH